MCDSGGHLSKLGPGQGALCTIPPLEAGLLVTPLLSSSVGPVTSTDLRYGDIQYLMVFQMENEVPCSRALLLACPASSLFIPVMGRGAASTPPAGEAWAGGST